MYRYLYLSPSLSLSPRVVINCNKIENSRFRIIRFHFALFIIFFAACCSCKFVAAAAAAKLSPSQVAHSKNIFIIFITIVILARKVLHSKSFVFGQLCCGWQASEGKQGEGRGRKEGKGEKASGKACQKTFHADNELTTDFWVNFPSFRQQRQQLFCRQITITICTLWMFVRALIARTVCAA